MDMMTKLHLTFPHLAQEQDEQLLAEEIAKVCNRGLQ